MGIASQDLTGDGMPEVYLTSQGTTSCRRSPTDPTAPRYEDIAIERGVSASRPYAGDVDLPSTAWHAEFEDVNNDGLMDLFVSKGNVERAARLRDAGPKQPASSARRTGPSSRAPRRPAIVSFSMARGAALADLNLDGLLDLIVVNRRENVKLWRNVGSGTPTRRSRWATGSR